MYFVYLFDRYIKVNKLNIDGMLKYVVFITELIIVKQI